MQPQEVCDSTASVAVPPLLLRTPAPRPTESLQGYVLRLSEANGYDTPWHVLTASGFSQDEMEGAGLPHRKLARVLSDKADALDPIAYHTTNEAGDRVFTLLGHRVGQGLSSAPLRLSAAHLCCRCVAEHGFVDALFDLSMAVACPIHRTWLTERCPACTKPLRFLRPGLLVCRCGARLDGAPEQPADPAVADLMAVLRAVLHRAPVDGDLSQGLPVDHLMAMPLAAMVRRLPAMARFAAAPAADPRASVTVCAQALADWPRGFHAYLGDVGRRVGLASEISIRKRFLKFYEGMFKSSTDNYSARDVAWMRDEFVRYGATQAPDAVVDPRLLRRLGSDAPKRLLNQSEMIEGMGVHLKTLRGLVDRGAVGAVRVGTAGRTRRMFDAAACAPLIEVARELGTPIQTREAAARLQLPVRVLERLAESGVYEQRLQLRQNARYYPGEIDAFRNRLTARAPRIEAIPLEAQPVVSLALALRKSRFHDHDAKAQFVVDYLEGRVDALGRTGDTTSSILFSRALLAERVANARSAASGDTLSQSEACRLLGVDHVAVSQLAELGFLQTSPGREGVRVSRASLEAFIRTHVALNGVARDAGTNSRRLMRVCQEAGIPVLELQRVAGSRMPFIERDHLARLGALLAASPKNPGSKRALTVF